MKVIFLKDVPKAGRRHEIKEVNDGYAQNFLFPSKLAEPATAKSVERIEKLKDTIRVEKEIKDDLLTKQLAALKEISVTIHSKTNASGHLFSGIKAEDIASALSKQHVSLPAEMIVLEKPIKELGTHAIPVSVKGKKTVFTLIVEPL